ASRLSTHAWATVRPAVTAAAPKASPDTPTAMPTPSPSRTAALRAPPSAAVASPVSVTLMAATLTGRPPGVLERSCASVTVLSGVRRGLLGGVEPGLDHRVHDAGEAAGPQRRGARRQRHHTPPPPTEAPRAEPP